MSLDVKDEINSLINKTANADKSEDALRFSQAALNLANANMATVVAEEKKK
jgi:hypothetical protein